MSETHWRAQIRSQEGEWIDVMDASGKLRAYRFESEEAVKQMFHDHYRWLGPLVEGGYPEGTRARQFPGEAKNE